MKPFIIGIAGKSGYGKSTVSKMIKDINGEAEPTLICSFAEPARSTLLRTFSELTPNHFKDRILKEKHIESLGASPRELLREFASGFARKHDPDVWVNHAEATYRELMTKSNPFRRKFSFVIFDDVRFDNEVAFIRRYGGTIIHLEREEPKKTFHQKLCDYFNIPHESQIGVRHTFDPSKDWVLNTSKPQKETFQEVRNMAAHRYDKGFEL